MSNMFPNIESTEELKKIMFRRGLIAGLTMACENKGAIYNTVLPAYVHAITLGKYDYLMKEDK